MGRELRMVPPNWNHPNNDRGHQQPMHDSRYEDRLSEWLADFDRVRAGHLTKCERECYASRPALGEWLADNSPPDRAYYRPWKDKEATWFQVWETVSEGTPITPPFATKEELIEYLVEYGDEWQQKRWREGNRFMQPEKPGYSREAAQAFVDSGWAPSMVISAGRIATGIDVPLMLKNQDTVKDAQ